MDSIQMLIPKTIHYCWFGGKNKPKSVRDCISSWRKKCPDYQIIEWNETNFNVESHPFTKSAYQQKAWAFVSDYARLKIIYDNGGIYLDTDVELLRSLDALLGNSFFIGVEQSQKLCTTGLGFGSTRENEILKKMMKAYDGILYDSNRKSVQACPYLNNKVLLEMGYKYVDEIVSIEGAKVYPCKYFDPIAPGKETHNLLCPETISIHHYLNSWGSAKSILKRSLINKLNPLLICTIKELRKTLFG